MTAPSLDYLRRAAEGFHQRNQAPAFDAERLQRTPSVPGAPMTGSEWIRASQEGRLYDPPPELPSTVAQPPPPPEPTSVTTTTSAPTGAMRAGEAAGYAGGADMRPVIDGPQAMAYTTGGAPAREVSRYGAKQWGAIHHARDVGEMANQAIVNRQVEQAAVEEAVSFQQAEKALEATEAIKGSQLARQQEADRRLQEMDRTVTEMSKQALDPNRFWASRTTGQKIMLTIGLGLSGWSTGHNQVREDINQAVARDIEAQRYQHEAKGAKKFEAQKGAYGAFLEKYQSADAAQNLAMASSLQAVAAQTRQMAAQQKSVDAQNKGAEFAARLEEQARDFMLTGYQYVQAQGAQRRYRVMRMGVPVDMTESQFAKYASEREGAGDAAAMKLLDVGSKGGADAEKRIDEGAKYIADKLQGADVPAARAAAENALKSLQASRPGYAERAARAVVGDRTGNFVGGGPAEERQQALATFRNRVMKVIAGNVTESEEKRIMAGLQGTGSPEEQMNGIRHALEQLDSIEKNVYAGAPPESQRLYQQRREAAGIGTPSTFKPRGP